MLSSFARMRPRTWLMGIALVAAAGLISADRWH